MENEIKQRRRLKFTTEEDEKLRDLVDEFGDKAWEQVASNMPGRNVRQCRERWKHYLSANKSGRVPFTEEEDRIIIEKYIELGPKWTKIAKFVKDRSDIQIKSRIIKKISSYQQALNEQPQIIIQQINLQPQNQKQETQLEPNLITNELINSQNKLINNDFIVKNEENESIKNTTQTIYDIPFDFYSHTAANNIEDGNIAGNIFYPLEF